MKDFAHYRKLYKEATVHLQQLNHQPQSMPPELQEFGLRVKPPDRNLRKNKGISIVQLSQG